jgi:hypothetical protein
MAYMILYARYFATYTENKTKNKKEEGRGQRCILLLVLHSSASKFMAAEILVDQLLFQI